MAQQPPLAPRLREELRHRLRPMRGRDPSERGRSATPVELLYDLTFVVAFSAAADQLATSVSDGHVGAGLGAYAFAIFGISWAWMNYTWFASAYGNDDLLFRIATLVQMVGVIILIFGLPASFASADHGQSPNNLTMVVGYIVMRVPQIALWVRAGQQDPQHRTIAVARVFTLSIAQLGWLLTVLVPTPVWATVAALVLLALAEMTVPVIVERRRGNVPWNAGHVAERFGLLTLITLGEVVAATTSAVSVLTTAQGWSLLAVMIVFAGVVLVAGFWWAYFLIPSRTILERWPERTFVWRYAHLPIFGAIAAVGAGLRVTAMAVQDGKLSVLQIALALAIPVGIMILMIFVLWSVLLRAVDPVHVPLFLGAITPLVAAVIVASFAGSTPLKADDPADMGLLAVVFVLVALCPVVEVVSHEIVGYTHTLRVLERGDDKTG
jgi:low temperature requirement protein LtrA